MQMSSGQVSFQQEYAAIHKCNVKSSGHIKNVKRNK
jgi:hypothetical protein